MIVQARQGRSGFGCAGFGCARGFGEAVPCTIESVTGDGSIIFAGDCDAKGTQEAVDRLARDNPVAYAQVQAKQRAAFPGSALPPGLTGGLVVPAGTPPPGLSKWAWAGIVAIPVVPLLVWLVKKARR